MRQLVVVISPLILHYYIYIGVTIPSRRQWPSGAFRSNILEIPASMELYLHLRIQNFLLSYHSTRHATTGTTPTKLFLQREVCTRLSLVHPDISLHVTNNQTKMKTYYDRNTKLRALSPRDRVLARDHLSQEKWRTGTIVTQQAPASYCIQLDDGRLWRRHTGRPPSEPDCSSAGAHCHEGSICCPRAFNAGSVFRPLQNCRPPSHCL